MILPSGKTAHNREALPSIAGWRAGAHSLGARDANKSGERCAAASRQTPQTSASTCCGPQTAMGKRRLPLEAAANGADAELEWQVGDRMGAAQHQLVGAACKVWRHLQLPD